MADPEKLKKDFDRKVKSYEGKLATLTAINSALQTENDKLRKQLEDSAKPSTATEAEIAELQEEFASRLGVADRQIAQLQDEKDRLRQQLQLAAQGGASTEARLHEKDEHVQSLQAEGEKLSRKNGELEATCRKVRAQLRDVEAARDHLSSRLAAMESQLGEHKQRAVLAEVALAEQQAAHEAQLREVQQAAEQRLDAAEQQAQSEAHRSLEQAAREAADALAASMEREASLAQNMAHLRAALDEKEEREADLRGEMAGLEGRVRELEAVNQALQSNTTDATRPLLRQIESMAAAASAQQAAARDAEHHWTQRVQDLESQLRASLEAQTSAAARAAAAEDSASAARNAAHNAAATAADMREQCRAEQSRCMALQRQLRELEEGLSRATETHRQALAEKDEQLQLAQERLWVAEQELRSIAATNAPPGGSGGSAARSGDGAPLNGGVPQPDRQYSSGGSSQAGRGPWTGGEAQGAQALGEADPPGGWDGDRHEHAQEGGVSVGQGLVADEMEEMLRSISLQAAPSRPLCSPKHSDQGRKESSRAEYLEAHIAMLEKAAAAANDALVEALARIQQLEADAKRSSALKRQLDTLQGQHSLLLEVLGERNEHVEQLEEDIRDMKRIFHEQLNVAVDQLHAARGELEQQRSCMSTPSKIVADGNDSA